MPRCIISGENDRTPYAHHHRGSLDVQALVLIQMIFHVEKHLSLRKTELHLITVLVKFDLTFFVDGDDPSFIESHRGKAFFSRAHGFAAFKADILHDKPGLARLILYLNIAFITKKPHCVGAVCFCRDNAPRDKR